jgi:membrane-bound ClpP family serine protease
MVEEFLFSGNVWLIIGLILAIIELSNGTLIVFLPMGVSGLLTGLLLKLQENGTLSNLIESWSTCINFLGCCISWSIPSLKLYCKKETSYKRR